MTTDPEDRFAAGWLALREPADVGARSVAVVEAAQRWASRRPHVRVLDLGCGSGANLRFLCPRLPVVQHWICVDHDPALIAELRRRGCDCASLAGLDARVGSIASPALPAELDRDTLVTASALLDLVPSRWLEWLLGLCRDRGCALLFALTYDGRAELHPTHPQDQEVIALVNAHQRRDKGLGPALGPEAATRLATLAEALGYRVSNEPSDWVLGPDEADLSSALLDGWLDAAREQTPERPGQLEAWHGSRRRAAERGELSVRVSHRDLFLEC
jgi:SAM-dependent methyltransferase